MNNQTLIGLLGLLEVLFVVVVVAVILNVKLRSSRRESADLRKQMSEAAVVSVRVATPVAVAAPAPDAPTTAYADFLRQQLDRSSLLLGEDVHTDAAQVFSQPDAEAHSRQMLAARHQFLQMELDQQDNNPDPDPQQQRRHLIVSMQALLDAMGWQQAPSAVDAFAAAGVDQIAEAQLTSRSEVIKLGEQITSLRKVIDNQHDSMRELRRLLEEQGDGSDELKAALKKLSNAEAQAVELYRCMEVVEGENERLKHAPVKTAAGGAAASEDADILRDLVNDQQRTIGSLQKLLRGLTPEGEKNAELDAAIDKIQRTNNELNACVMLLEDENNMLRSRSEDLQARLDRQEADAVAAVAAAAAAAAAIESSPTPAPESAAAVAADEPEAATEIEVDALLESATVDEPIEVVAASIAPASADEADFDIDSLFESAVAPVNKVEPVVADEGSEAVAESMSPAAADADADFDIDSLLESAAAPVSKVEPVMVDQDIETDPESPVSPPVDDAEVDFDIDSLLESAAAPVPPSLASETIPIADDIDALIGQFGQGAAPATLRHTEKPLPAKDETDALLAELFGSSADDSR